MLNWPPDGRTAMRGTNVVHMKPAGFRIIVLFAVLLLVSTLYVMVRQDRLNTELREGVMQGEATRVHSALRGGADAKGVVMQDTGPGLLEKLLHGQNPFIVVPQPMR